MIPRKTESEILIMEKAGRILANIFADIKEEIKVGKVTEELEKLARNLIKKYKVESSFLGYRGYPVALCCSINEEVVHGIPGKRKLRSGDLVSLDLGIKYRGFHVDRAETIGVGKISLIHKKMIKVGQKALIAGIKKIRAGNYIRDIAKAIQDTVERAGFSVVRDCTGHGVGRKIHEEPNIPNYDTGASGPQLKEGMVLAIEPMVCEKDYRVETKNDNWTVLTVDRKASVHFEETVLVSKKSAKILTAK